MTNELTYRSHSVGQNAFHFVWKPKYSSKFLRYEPDNKVCRGAIRLIAIQYSCKIYELQIMPDHIHFFVSAAPKWAPMKIVQTIKQITSKRLREKYATIRQTRSTPDFWATGYYCGTAGHVSANQVARYIVEQTEKLKKNWNLFDIKPFEYDINEKQEMHKDQKTLDTFGIGGFNSPLRSA